MMKFGEKRALVTGGGGFIGCRLVQALLREGCRVRVLDVQQGRLKGVTKPNLEFAGLGGDPLHRGMYDGDVVTEAVRDVDVVYHLAINWNGHAWRHMLPIADLFDVNLRGTLNLLEAAKSQGVEHFLFSSSCAVYGKAKAQVVDEETACKPELWEGDPGPAYGIVKLTTEKLCLMYYHRHGLPVTVFRIEVVFDDQEAQIIGNRIVNDVMKGEPIEVVEGDGQASIHVDEVVDAFLLATSNEAAYGQVFNISNPATFISDQELYELLIGLTNSKNVIRLVTDPNRVNPMVESIEKIRSGLGWAPKKTKEDLNRAIAHTVESIVHSS
jgi:nucleoside-diphosphate-sugar epimerase